ncbi:hypothetical protein GGX14DRAFT_574673 [Mycena pura]|uniref:Uncharacterized protein n=1 Tax=Mycena pura TaxID=153505 RepID=A0AAD6V0T8_9AGAR|nr:hypothetical protein GGX14DRAFT_574673 [Mycena pura]
MRRNGVSYDLIITCTHSTALLPNVDVHLRLCNVHCNVHVLRTTNTATRSFGRWNINHHASLSKTLPAVHRKARTACANSKNAHNCPPGQIHCPRAMVFASPSREMPAVKVSEIQEFLGMPPARLTFALRFRQPGSQRDRNNFQYMKRFEPERRAAPARRRRRMFFSASHITRAAQLLPARTMSRRMTAMMNFDDDASPGKGKGQKRKRRHTD